MTVATPDDTKRRQREPLQIPVDMQLLVLVAVLKHVLHTGDVDGWGGVVRPNRHIVSTLNLSRKGDARIKFCVNSNRQWISICYILLALCCCQSASLVQNVCVRVCVCVSVCVHACMWLGKKFCIHTTPPWKKGVMRSIPPPPPIVLITEDYALFTIFFLTPPLPPS